MSFVDGWAKGWNFYPYGAPPRPPANPLSKPSGALPPSGIALGFYRLFAACYGPDKRKIAPCSAPVITVDPGAQRIRVTIAIRRFSAVKRGAGDAFSPCFPPANRPNRGKIGLRSSRSSGRPSGPSTTRAGVRSPRAGFQSAAGAQRHRGSGSARRNARGAQVERDDRVRGAPDRETGQGRAADGPERRFDQGADVAKFVGDGGQTLAHTRSAELLQELSPPVAG